LIFFDYVLPSDHSGGISVLWCNKSIHASVLLKEQRAIHMLLYDPVCPQMSVVSGIYAPAQVHQKPSFWTHPKDLNGVMDSPWCLIGDFNELEHANDKRGGRILSPSHFDKINSFQNGIHGSSVKCIGSPFTWKKRLHMHLIYERLDRAIIREDWGQLYPHTYITHGCFTCSDHCPIILTTDSRVDRPKAHPFRYQNFWSQYPESTKRIRNSWQTAVYGT